MFILYHIRTINNEYIIKFYYNYLRDSLWIFLRWFICDEFDAVMNYSLQESIDSFWSNKQSTATDFEFQINRCLNMYPEHVCNVMFNLLDSHDTMRLITRSNNNIDEFYQKLCVLFTMNGTVCIYYGTEIILPGGYDPDCRRCMPWNDIEKGKDNKNIETAKSLISMRKNYEELRNGEIRFLPENSGRIIAYEKFSSNITIRIIINCSKTEYTLDTNFKQMMFERGLKRKTLKPNGAAIMLM